LAYKDHPWFAACHHFCACYDQAAFDPNYPTQTLEYFEPLLRAVFSRKAFDPAVIQAAA
jgi:predicted HD phosphohydrolase